MRGKALIATLALMLIVGTLALPAAAFAGGDQVNRPDEAGYFDDGLQAGGDAPVWAPREQQTSQP